MFGVCCAACLVFALLDVACLVCCVSHVVCTVLCLCRVFECCVLCIACRVHGVVFGVCCALCFVLAVEGSQPFFFFPLRACVSVFASADEGSPADAVLQQGREQGECSANLCC